MKSTPLTPEELAIYDWQMGVAGVGESGQERLKAATVLISRCGGLGGVAAFELAAAGVGRLVIAHAGVVHPGDLNRQLLQTHADIGLPRLPGIERRLKALNPQIELVLIPENASSRNADALMPGVDVVIDAAPLFEERYALNAAAMRHGIPMVEAAVYAMEGTLTTFLPGSTPCLACLYPEQSPEWQRRFPVFGAVSGTLGSLAAAEAIKLIVGFGTPLAGQLLTLDAGTMHFQKHHIRRDPRCPVCSSIQPTKITSP